MRHRARLTNNVVVNAEQLAPKMASLDDFLPTHRARQKAGLFGPAVCAISRVTMSSAVGVISDDLAIHRLAAALDPVH